MTATRLIVPATIADGRRIAELHAKAFPDPWDEAGIVRLLAAPAGLALIATTGPDTPTDGVIIAFLAADEAEILTLAVRADRRRRGIAGDLVRSLCAAVSDAGATRLYLDVGARNASARALYASLGFRQTGRRRGYYPATTGLAPEDAIQLEKGLARNGD